MNTRKLLLLVALLPDIYIQTSGQSIFNKLKKKAEDITVQKGTEILENSTKQKPSPPAPDADDCIGAANPALEIKTELKKEFYTADVVVEMLSEKNIKTIGYFDVEVIAMKTVQPEGSGKSAFMDSEGFFYGFNEEKGYYEKSSMLSMGSLTFLGPSIMVSQYKLPSEPFFEKYEYFSNEKVKPFPFMYLEFTFLYKPEHFIVDGYTKVAGGQAGFTRFNNTAPGYEGSYVVFDDQNRLVKINISVNTEEFKGTGYINYAYSSNKVCLPEAKEVKMPMQDIFEKGMNPNNN